MKRTRIFAGATALLVASVPLSLAGAGTAHAAGHTYYVSPSGSDGNPGTSAQRAFRSLQKAADSTSPGDTVLIMNGTYTEQAVGADVVTISRSGTAGAPITYQAYPGQHPVIHPVTAWNGVHVSGASYIVIKGLDIRGNNSAITLAEAERGASTTKAKFNTNCLSVEKNRRSSAQSHHIDIRDNTVHDCAGGGISAIDADYVTIDRNHVFATSWYSVFATSGISILTALDSDSAGDGKKYKIRITNNTVHDNETKVKWEHCKCYSDGNGIIIDTLKDKATAGAHGADYRGRVLVANNLSYENGGSGIHSYKSQHVDIINNTAYLNGRSPRMKPYGNIYANDSRDVRLLNNIASSRPAQPAASKYRNVDVVYDYNLYFGGKAPEMKGAHDVVSDPKFVSPEADFRLRKGSPAIGTGTLFAAVTTDITGASRTGTVDRGAYSAGAPAHAADRNLSTVGASATASPSDSQSAAASTATDAGTDSGTDADSGTHPEIAGESQESAHSGSDLAQTGGDIVAPFGGAFIALLLGAGIFFLARRKRS